MNKDDLKKYDFIVAIDKSGSMGTKDCKNGLSRWKHAQEQTENIARACAEFDDDGIDVVLFGNKPTLFTGTTPDKVHQIFTENEPGGSTDTAAAVKLIVDGYFARKAAGKAKPIIVVVVTDGVPDSKEALASVIVEATKKIDADEEIGITFVQVGSDPDARAFLKDLDDNLTGAKFDIVDTKNDEEMDGITVSELLIEAITD